MAHGRPRIERGVSSRASFDVHSSDGGGRRTRTFEVIRRLIYSQLPLPLGTLPRSTASEPIRRNGGNKAVDDVKTGRRWRAPGWRVYGGCAMAKSTNGGG